MKLIDLDKILLERVDPDGRVPGAAYALAWNSIIDLLNEQPAVDPKTLPLVSQLKAKNEVLLKFLSGERVEAETLVATTGWSFEQCCKRFELNRVAEWWSIVGKTNEERSRNGQKITCYFCIPQLNNKRGET